jgi:hypothetical protein
MQLGLFSLGVADAELSDYATIVATSDRVQLDPRSNEQLSLDRRGSWSGVRAMCSGVPVAEEKSHYASRWKYMLAVPIRLDDPEGFVAGALVLSTTATDSRLRSVGTRGKLLTEEYAQLREALMTAGTVLLQR